MAEYEVRRAELDRLLARLSPAQMRAVRHLLRLLLLQQIYPGDPSIEAEIAAIQQAAEDGRTVPVPSIH